MSFNIDDPLAGILSDGSDDSFFDDDVLGKTKTPKQKETSIAQKKNALFDIKVPETQTDNVKADDDNLVGDVKSPAPFKRTFSKDSVKFNQSELRTKAEIEKIDTTKSPMKSKPTGSADKLNILSDFNTETKNVSAKPPERGKSSQSLLDDILGGSSVKTSGSSHTTRPASVSRKQEFDLDSILGNTELKQTNSSKIATQKSVKVENPKDTFKAKKTKSNEDWLGIFQDKDDIIVEEDTDDIPTWLGGGNKRNKDKTEQNVETEHHTVDKLKPEIDTPKEVSKLSKTNTDTDNNIRDEQAAKLTTILDNTHQDLTMEGAALYLQQQESQLMVALQLKAQDEKLASMQLRQKESQRVQREAAVAQHEQIDSMLRRQAEHRHQMQNIIAAHQERITQRIKALLGELNTDYDENTGTNGYEDAEKQRDSPFSKERKQLLQLVQSLQENHDKEVDLMETSYRRQLAFLEVSFSQTEERMKDESEKVVKFYAEKISWLEEHHELYKKMYEDNLNSLTERHKAEHELLRQQHLENIKVLQEHHGTLMENIKNAVKQEQLLIKDSAGFSTDLQELIVNVKMGNDKCLQLYEKVDFLSQNTQRDSERSLQIRESQITDMIEQLGKDRKNFEKEKSESKDLVNMLEARLKQMTSMIEEESVILRQKKMEFEFEKATFSKQTEFAKNVLKKQDEEIKMLKEDIEKAYQEKNAKIEEERAKAIKDSALVAKEKASIQNLKLELEKTKAELQAQLEEMMEERTKINTEKQELHLEEQRVMSKSRDLDLLAKTAMEKQSQADKKYAEAEFLQRKYEDRIRRVQEHVVSLNAREKQIAKEKVALSRERLSLHNERKEIEGRQQCSLCRSAQYNAEYTYVPTYNMPVSREYRNMSSPVNVLDQEMAQLMGRVQQGMNIETNYRETGPLKDYTDPKLMMLRLDVQQVIGHLDQNKKDEEVRDDRQEL